MSIEDGAKIHKIVSKYDNLSAWAEASGLPSKFDGYGEYVVDGVGGYWYKIKNPGDANAIIKITFPH